MRVLLTADTVGGVWDYAVTLARELRGAGAEVMLAVLGEPTEERLADLPAGVEVAARPFRLEWMEGAAADLRPAADWLRGLAAAWRADLVHLNQMAYAAHGLGAPTLVVVHSDVLSWFREVQGHEAPPEWAPYARRVAEGLRAADRVTAPSRYQAALTERHYGRAVDRVIHNGAVAPSGEPPPRRADAPVLSVGRAWDEAKGMRTYEEAIRILGDAAPPAHLCGELAGPGGEGFAPGRLVCHGPLGRAGVERRMREATVYVSASRYEPFGLAPLEAALAGCALVLSDIGSFRELWEGCALFFPRGDARSLADALARLRDEPGRRAALADAAGLRARERYGAGRFGRDYLALYRELLGAPGAAPAGAHDPAVTRR
jgi:glycogen synthase